MRGSDGPTEQEIKRNYSVKGGRGSSSASAHRTAAQTKNIAACTIIAKKMGASIERTTATAVPMKNATDAPKRKEPLIVRGSTFSHILRMLSDAEERKISHKTVTTNEYASRVSFRVGVGKNLITATTKRVAARIVQIPRSFGTVFCESVFCISIISTVLFWCSPAFHYTPLKSNRKL